MAERTPAGGTGEGLSRYHVDTEAEQQPIGVQRYHPTHYQLDPEFGQKGAEYVGLLRVLGYGAPLTPARSYGGGEAMDYARHGGLAQTGLGYASGKFFEGAKPQVLTEKVGPQEKVVRAIDGRKIVQEPVAGKPFLRRYGGSPKTVQVPLGTPKTVRIWTMAPKTPWEATAANWWTDLGAVQTWSGEAWSGPRLLDALSQTYLDIQTSAFKDRRRWDVAGRIAALATTMLARRSVHLPELGFEDEAPVIDVPTVRRMRQARVIRLGRPTPSLADSADERRAAEDVMDA